MITLPATEFRASVAPLSKFAASRLEYSPSIQAVIIVDRGGEAWALATDRYAIAAQYLPGHVPPPEPINVSRETLAWIAATITAFGGTRGKAGEGMTVSLDRGPTTVRASVHARDREAVLDSNAEHVGALTANSFLSLLDRARDQEAVGEPFPNGNRWARALSAIGDTGGVKVVAGRRGIAELYGTREPVDGKVFFEVLAAGRTAGVQWLIPSTSKERTES